ncbi:MAG: hypothetical protein QNJ32_27450 [Xenococcaceae cyanobacterium MO_167.B27]|nr:hypothetical protein [Xenococcaceae cyanobacterium MO_167.B27]
MGKYLLNGKGNETFIYQKEPHEVSSREIMLKKLSQAESKLKSLTGEEKEKQKIILDTLYEVWNDCFANRF